MKKILSSGFATILVIMLVASTALAATNASYEGSIWTGKPIASGVGYYCTAARNDSGGDESTHWAWARTYYSGTYSYKWMDGNKRAVASSDQIHPTSGEGQYGEKGWSSTIGKFASTAWD